MAIKTRDTVVINDTGLYLERSKYNLLMLKNKLLSDISNVLNDYKGKDADIIVLKFNEAVEKLNSFINNLDYYSKYMLALSGHDRENIQNINKKLKVALENVPMEITNIYDINNLDYDTNKVDI